MKNLLNIFNPSVSKIDRKGVNTWLGAWINTLRSNGEIKVTVEKDDVQRSIYHGALALSIVVEAFAYQYSATSMALVSKMRRERLKAMPYLAVTDEADDLLLGLSMINTDRSTWFTDDTYQDLIYRVVDEYGMDEAVNAMSYVALHLCKMLSSQHTRVDFYDIALRVGDTFVDSTSANPTADNS